MSETPQDRRGLGPLTTPRREFLSRLALGVAAVPLLDACGDDETVAPSSDTSDASPLPDEGPAEPAFVLDAAALDATVFPGPPISGGATGTSALFAGTTTLGNATLLLWPDGGGASTVRTVQGTVSGGFSSATVDDLEPGLSYHYAWVSGSADAPGPHGAVGRLKSPPAAGQSPVVRIGATACTKMTFKPFTALSVMAAQGELDLFCHLGDMSYNDSASTLEEYRKEWLETLTESGYQALLPVATTLITWDDHEIANGEWGDLDAAHRDAGMQAFFEALPVRRRENGALWNSYRWGDTVEVFVLDCRSERKPDTRLGPDAEFISKAQLEWLEGALEASPCRFKLVMTSLPISRFPDIWPKPDVWMGYEAQRTRLLDHIAAKAPGTLFVSGDYHFGSVHRVDTTGPHAGMWEILAGPGASSPNPLIGAVTLAPDLADTYVPAAQFEYYSLDYCATFLTFDPNAGTVDVEFIGADDGKQRFKKTIELG